MREANGRGDRYLDSFTRSTRQTYLIFCRVASAVRSSLVARASVSTCYAGLLWAGGEVALPLLSPAGANDASALLVPRA